MRNRIYQLINFSCALILIVFLSSCECHHYKYYIKTRYTYYKTDEYKIKNNCIYFKADVGIGKTKFIDVIFCDGFSVIPAD